MTRALALDVDDSQGGAFGPRVELRCASSIDCFLASSASSMDSLKAIRCLRLVILVRIACHRSAVCYD